MPGEELLLINPRRKGRHRKGRMPPALARYWATHRRKLRNPKRRKATRARTRRRALVQRVRRRAAGYTVGTRKIRRRKLNPRGRRHTFRARRRHRNPRFGMGSIVRNYVGPAAIGATGAIALDIAYSFIQPRLPVTMQTGYVATGAKLGAALLLGWGASKLVGKQRAQVATLGAITIIGYGAIKQLAQRFFPTLPGLSGYQDFVDYSAAARPPGVGAYQPRGVGFYSPAAVIPGSGQPSGVGAYLPPSGIAGLDGYDWRSDGM